MARNLRDFRARETLRDGRPVLIRAIERDDKASLVRGFERLSSASVYNRFHSPRTGLSAAELEYLTDVDFVRHVALVALVRADESDLLVGVGRFIVDDPDARVAEVALTVDDEHQGLGVGTLLLSHMAELGRESGLLQFRAEVLGTNRQMLDVLERCGLPMRRTVSRGEITVYLSLHS